MADNAIDAIVTVNLANYQQSIISQSGVRGAGDGFQGINSMSFGDTAGSTVYVTNQSSDKIARVDLATGNRETIATGCAAGYPPDELGNDGRLLQVWYDSGANELLILGDRLFNYELTPGICTKIPLSTRPLVIQGTGQGQILAVGFQALVQIDRDTGEVVIVSK